MFTALLVSAGAVITFVITMTGTCVYWIEAGDRDRERALREIEILNSAWVRIDAVRGKPRGDRYHGAERIGRLFQERPAVFFKDYVALTRAHPELTRFAPATEAYIVSLP